ncbi:MAG TPA: TetR/AcrR family transcriptional regulator [Polyangiaceae bacterium]|nr:TetR/AcrR family transcriptional regulator [Polyangiaceae bacterium]
MQRKRAPVRPARKATGKASAATKKSKKAPSSASAAAAATASTTATDGRRRELVLAAYKLIAEIGLEELRTRDIAAKVGINISTLHYYFETKEDLIAAVVDHMTELFRTLRAPLPAGATALEELRHAFVTQAYRRRVEPSLEVVVQEMMMRARRDEKVRVRLEQMLLGWNGYVEALIARGIASGDFASDLDPKIAAAIVTAFAMGSNVQSGVRPSSFPQEAAYERLVALLKPR